MTEIPFPHQSRADYVYQALRDGIRQGRHGQGERIREEEVAKALGVSRTPVREALHRLQARGLLEFAQGRGLVVVALSRHQVLELYAMRAVLEGAAAGLAAQHAAPAELAAMRRLAEEFAAADGDVERMYRVNRMLHQTIYEAAHNRYLLESLEHLSDAMALLRDTTFAVQGRPPVAAAEHSGLVRLIADRQGAAAETAARQHIQAALEARLQLQFAALDALPGQG